MTNMFAVIVYIVFLVFSIGSMVSVLTKSNKIIEEKLFVSLAAMIVGWTITYIIWDLLEKPDQLRTCYSLFYPFIAFVPPILLVLTNRFCRVHPRIPKVFWATIFAIPAFITGMALTANDHDLIFTSFEVLRMAPIREVYIEYGIGFWVHTAYCYIVTLASLVLLVFSFRKTPKYNQFSLILFACGIAVSLFGNVFTLMHVFPVSLDPTLVFANIAIAFYYFAIMNNTKSYFIAFSRQWVFSQIDDMILILDTNETVADFNEKAKHWFGAHKIAVQNRPFSEITAHFFQKTHHFFEDHNPDEVGIDYQFVTIERTYIFYIRKKPFTDMRGNTIGSVVIFNDVTQNRLLQEKLEKRAGIDALTGLNNRTAFERVHKQLDTEIYLPLAVIICDVNGLKKTNDTYGHSYGDLMLKEVAKILESCCPPKGFLARLGGDEFIYLLSNTTEENARRVVKNAKEKFLQSRDEHFHLAVAMGCSVKEKPEESFHEVFLSADQKMYSDKKGAVQS